jgi:predicted nucleic acid-binding protein
VNLHLDANAVIEWERGRFDLPTWIVQNHPNDELRFSAAAWQELMYGAYAWEPARAQKRVRFLRLLGVSVRTYAERQADRAARIAAELKDSPIGFSDCQVAATALEDNAALLTFNREHFSRVPGLRLAAV